MSMRQLRTCDFCGEDAAGIYEVVPAELSPTETEQRRVVLCEDCFDTLETVVSPLLARLGVESDHQPSASSAAATQSPSDADEATTDAPGPADHSETDRSDEERVEEEEPNEDYEVDAADRKRAADDPAEDYEVADDETAEPETDATAASADAESVGEEPPQFRKVMRLLNNREFPVARAEITDIATGAYGLEEDEVDAIIDYAVERDVLSEDDGELYKA